MKSNLKRTILLILATCAMSGVQEQIARAQTNFLGPSPYLSFNDSPFSANTFAYFHLEDFESGALIAPGVTASPGWVVNNPDPYTDSVDADDGVIDGSGTNAHSYYSNLTQTNLTFSFDASVLENLPTHVGLVWTDVGIVFSGETGYGNVLFSAYDANGILIGSLYATNLGNGSALGSGPGATSEDRFFGVINPGGISSISMSMDNSADWEVDHLQYGLLSAVVAQPTLQIQLIAPDTAMLTWATNSTGFVLQEEDDLTTTNWLNVTNSPTTDGGSYEVILSLLPNPEYFRLSLP